MKIRLIILFSFSLLMLSCGSKKKGLNQKYGLEEKKEKSKSKHTPTLAEIFAETISADDLDYHLYNLASDSMRGRETGKRGQKKAADYISHFFLDQNLLFPRELDGYKQKFTASKNSMPEVVLETDRKAYEYGKDLISFFPHDSIKLQDNHIIFAGYGIDDYRYSDYAFQDVKGKIVLIVGGEPKDKYGNYIISATTRGSEWSDDPIHAYIKKRNAAQKHGAKALLIYDPERHDYFWKNFKKHFEDKSVSISVKKDSVYDFFIDKDIFTDLTGYDKPSDMTFNNKRARKFDVPISLSYKNTNTVVESENVMGIIRGDEKSDDFILVISHYDGQGVIGGKVYPSANNNASGVAASFEIIEAFKAAIDSGFVPKRNILFVNFSGTEQNMLGSRYYIKHPIVPLSKTKAVIELNRLGRLKNESEISEFYPLNISSTGFGIKAFRNKINTMQSYNDFMTIKYKPLVERADYTQFMKKEVPVIYLYGNASKDFHGPMDRPDKISYDILEKRTRFIFQIIWDLAYQKKL